MKTYKCLSLLVLFFGLAAVSARADAVMRAGDSFELRIGGVPSDEISVFNNVYTIDIDGNLNLPYINKLNVSGMTPSQIQATIERTYRSREIYTNPTITLVVSQNRFVSVGGEGAKGNTRVPYTPDLTVLSAINAAGGFNEFADQKKVRLLRGNEVIMVNCKDIRRDPSKDRPVIPGDRIEVPIGFW